MNQTNERIIRTHLYSKIALEVLQSVEGQLSDGLYENSPAMEKYWRFSNVTTAPDGEVVIKISNEQWKWNGNHRSTYNGFADMSDAEIIQWFATKVKHIMQAEIKDDGHQLMKAVWSRYNDVFKTQYLSYNEKITVSDVYFIYDFLKGRDVTKKYEGDMSLKIVRAPLSDEETKKEETRRANIAKLEAEWSESLKKLEAEKKAAIAKLEEEFNKKRTAVNDEFKAKREAIKA